MIKKVTKAAQVRSYVAANPKAKPAEVAKEIGVGLQYVYTVLWNAKKKAGVKKKATLTLPKAKWGTTHIASSNVSVKDKLKEYETKKTKEQVDKYWQAVGEVQKAGLSAARVAELTALAGKPKARMQSSEPMQIDMFEPELDDLVNHPAHYKVGGIETIDFIEAKKLNYNIGNVVKYLTRADHKGNKLEDLRKAQWYLTREIGALK
jgi:hypothetical protein